MVKLIPILGSLIAGLVILSGCHGGSWQQPETLLDRNWGRSHHQQKYNQIINHDGGASDPVEGMAGESVTNTVEKYNNSFKDGKKQETVNILKLK